MEGQEPWKVVRNKLMFDRWVIVILISLLHRRQSLIKNNFEKVVQFQILETLKPIELLF